MLAKETVWSRIVRPRRLQLQLSQAEVAQRITPGMSSEMIAMIENGNRRPRLLWVPLLADALLLDRQDVCKLALYEQVPEIYLTFWGHDPPVPFPVEIPARETGSSEQEELLHLILRMSEESRSALLHIARSMMHKANEVVIR